MTAKPLIITAKYRFLYVTGPNHEKSPTKIFMFGRRNFLFSADQFPCNHRGELGPVPDAVCNSKKTYFKNCFFSVTVGVYSN